VMLATSIMSQISVEELTAVGLQIQTRTFRGFEAYLVIAAIYLVMSWLLRVIMNLCYNVAFPRQRHISQARSTFRPGAPAPSDTSIATGAKP